MKKSTAKQQAQNIAKNHTQPKRAECTKSKPNKNAKLGHYKVYKENQGMWSDDITCPKNSGHKEFATEGHVMPTCKWCGHVSLKASRNGLERTVWTTSE